MAPKYLVVIQGDYLAYPKPYGNLLGNGKQMFWESLGVSYYHLRTRLKYPWRKWSVTYSHPNYNLQLCDIKNKSFKNGTIVNVCWGEFGSGCISCLCSLALFNTLWTFCTLWVISIYRWQRCAQAACTSGQAWCCYYWSSSKKRCIHPVSRVWTGGKLNTSAEKIISHCLSPVVVLTPSLLAAAIWEEGSSKSF